MIEGEITLTQHMLIHSIKFGLFSEENKSTKAYFNVSIRQGNFNNMVALLKILKSIMYERL